MAGSETERQEAMGDIRVGRGESRAQLNTRQSQRHPAHDHTTSQAAPSTPPSSGSLAPTHSQAPGTALTWALLQEAVSSLHPVALTLCTSIRRPIAFPSALLPALRAAGRAGAPAGPLVPVSIHCPAQGRKGQGAA